MPRHAFALLLVAAALGCSQRARTVEIDEPRLQAEIERRFAAAVDSPRVNQRFDTLVSQIVADPAVATAGEGLLGSLGEDPGIAASAATIMEQLGSNPAVVASTQALMRAHPEASADQVGALAAAQIGQVTEGPIFSRAWDRAWSDLLKTPEMTALVTRFGERVGHNQAFQDAMRAGVLAHISDAKISARLVELNGGEAPARDKATDLLLARVFPVERLAGFYDDVFGLPVVKREATALVRDLASSKAFQQHVVTSVRAMFGDAAVRERAVDVMVVVMDPAVTEDKLYAALQRLLTTPALRGALASMVDGMLADDELGAIGTRTLTAIVRDPAFQAKIVAIFDGW
jgi:hypothetical protein